MSRTTSPWQEDSKVPAQGIVWLLNLVTVSRVLGCGAAYPSSSAAPRIALPLLVTSNTYTLEGMKGETISQLAPAFTGNCPIPQQWRNSSELNTVSLPTSGPVQRVIEYATKQSPIRTLDNSGSNIY